MLNIYLKQYLHHPEAFLHQQQQQQQQQPLNRPSLHQPYQLQDHQVPYHQVPEVQQQPQVQVRQLQRPQQHGRQALHFERRSPEQQQENVKVRKFDTKSMDIIFYNLFSHHSSIL